MNHAYRYLLPVAAAVLLSAGLGACGKSPNILATSSAASASVLDVPNAPNVTDVDVTEHVKTALLQAESLKGMNISVQTLNGDVQLNGVVNSQAQIDDAVRIARAADGAHAVHDHLTIQP
jgi:hyperosmotically inducible protein